MNYYYFFRVLRVSVVKCPFSNGVTVYKIRRRIAAMDKASLIARKHEVIAQIARVRRELERENQRASKQNKRRRSHLQRQLDALMSEEYRLRLQIDRSK